MAKTKVRVETPRGEFQWITITGPGKENLSGKMQYLANIAFDPKAPKWAALRAEVDAFWEANRPKKIKEPKSNGFYDEMVKTDETDEDGEAIKKATGRQFIAFKTNTEWSDGEGGFTPNVIKTYNARGREVQLGSVKIGNGSEGVVLGSYDIYVNKTKQGAIVDAGVTFFLTKLKINKLVEFGDDNFAEDDEAGEEEGAFMGVADSFESVEANEQEASSGIAKL